MIRRRGQAFVRIVHNARDSALVQTEARRTHVLQHATPIMGHSRAMRALLLCLLVACGGEVAPVADGGSSTDSSMASADAADVFVHPTPFDCTGALANEQKLEQDARACCPTCNTIQCSHTVQGLCCPIPTSAPTDDALTQAVQQLRAVCAAEVAQQCQGGACVMSSMPTCIPLSSTPMMGMCR